MSIDLATRIQTPVGLRALIPQVAIVLRDLLGTSTLPEFVLDVLDAGKRSPAVTDELRDRSTPFFLISIVGELETVGLLTDGEYVSVTMAAQRTRLEYALGTAVAIALARNFGGKIEDDRGFFGPPGEVSAEEMFERLRLKPDSEACDLPTLAERLRLGDDRIK